MTWVRSRNSLSRSLAKITTIFTRYHFHSSGLKLDEVPCISPVPTKMQELNYVEASRECQHIKEATEAIVLIYGGSMKKNTRNLSTPDASKILVPVVAKLVCVVTAEQYGQDVYPYVTYHYNSLEWLFA